MEIKTSQTMEDILRAAAEKIRAAKYLTAFTGAGISVESGIPPFRGPGGIWNKYDPSILDLDTFRRQPGRSWPAIREMFANLLGAAGRPAVQPNTAHRVLAKWEAEGRIQAVITQNIDGLHAAAGSRRLVEFHGHCRGVTCLECGRERPWDAATAEAEVPRCPCGGLFKPGFVFFGEGIPPAALAQAEEAARRTDCMILVGTSGVVYPAAALPMLARRGGATLIEVNPEPSDYTGKIVDLFIPLPAGDAFGRLERHVAAVRPPRG
ncbi:MAG TPA: Sir2 family NAD-dependent protein deacetylase [Kiritimatiellia bacterium]|nr:Sir2 family NAD-dependent protein deacetylase [Kiritimatiellia bacterium]HQN80674.1 Sir2 family NAD-dependent protein deacetylase [Kiritimatiellia bacterium]